MAYSYTAEREYNLTVMKGFMALFAIICFITVRLYLERNQMTIQLLVIIKDFSEPADHVALPAA